MKLDGLLALLDGVQRNGHGWMARCPGHEDREARLSIGLGDDDRIPLKCHAGCATRAILAKLGLRMRDLFPSRNGGTRGRDEAATKRHSVVACCDYHDEMKELLYQDQVSAATPEGLI